MEIIYNATFLASCCHYEEALLGFPGSPEIGSFVETFLGPDSWSSLGIHGPRPNALHSGGTRSTCWNYGPGAPAPWNKLRAHCIVTCTWTLFNSKDLHPEQNIHRQSINVPLGATLSILHIVCPPQSWVLSDMRGRRSIPCEKPWMNSQLPSMTLCNTRLIWLFSTARHETALPSWSRCLPRSLALDRHLPRTGCKICTGKCCNRPCNKT